MVLGDKLGEFGAAVGTSGDMDGDGRQELIVGSPGSSDGAGMAQIIAIAEVRGCRLGGSAAWGTLTGAAGRLSQTVHASADVVGDGHPDAIVGALMPLGAGSMRTRSTSSGVARHRCLCAGRLDRGGRSTFAWALRSGSRGVDHR